MKKTKDCVSENLILISEQSKLLESKKAADSSQSSISDDKYTENDILFIESKSKFGKNKNWKHIYDEGKV